MKWLVRIGVIIFCVWGCFYRMPVIDVSSGDQVTKSFRYVALGDSIAYGYGLQNPEKDSYVGIVKTYLQEQYEYVFCKNFGTNGLRSEELLDILTNPENENYRSYRATLKNADAVTVSIGSNDLLHHIELDANLGKLITDGGAIFRKSCSDFTENFKRIMEEIRKLAPDADIYCNNIYNPIYGVRAFEDYYEPVEYYIDLINETFRHQKGFHVVKVKETFENSNAKMVKMALNGTEPDPHPTKEGYRKIGELLIQIMQREG